MKANEISNPKTEVSKGTKLNEKDYLNSLLTHLKELSKNYILAMTEASNQQLFEKFAVTLKKVIKMQREVYELMFRNGWYSLEEAPKTK